MAIRHVKSRTLLTTNQSSSCLALCDPSCPDSCQDYFPPLPPSESSPVPLPSSPSTVGDTSGNNHRFPPMVIIIMAFLGSAFLIVSYYVIISKSCLWYRSRRNRNRHLNNNRSPSDQSVGGDDDYLDGTRIDHPIWYIRTIGLSHAVINSIPVVKYDKSNGSIEGTDCTVCLSEFQEGETLRVLPKCNHAFHMKCIDTWLGSHVNCPLCRAHVVVPGQGVFDDNISSVSRHSLEETQRNIDYSGNLSSRDENQMDGTFVNDSNSGGSDAQARNNSGVLGVIPENVHDGRETSLPEGNSGRNWKEGLVGANGLLGQVVSDVDRHILVDVEETRFGRRSISMDSHSRLSNFHMEEIRIDVDGGNGTVSGATESSSDHQPQKAGGDACAGASDSAYGSSASASASDSDDSNSSNFAMRSFSWGGRNFMHGINRGAN